MAMMWLGNVRYPPETMTDLSDKEWMEKLREKYGDRLCIFEPKDGGVPWRSSGEWRERGMIGVYLKGVK